MERAVDDNEGKYIETYTRRLQVKMADFSYGICQLC